jgi:hypothetical protein
VCKSEDLNLDFDLSDEEFEVDETDEDNENNALLIIAKQ